MVSEVRTGKSQLTCLCIKGPFPRKKVDFYRGPRFRSHPLECVQPQPRSCVRTDTLLTTVLCFVVVIDSLSFIGVDPDTFL